MQRPNHANDTSHYSFQADLLNLNLHLSETEKAAEPQTQAHEVALAQMRTLAKQS